MPSPIKLAAVPAPLVRRSNLLVRRSTLLVRRSTLLVRRSTTLVRRSTHLGSCSAVLVLGVPPTWADAAPAESPFGPLFPFLMALWLRCAGLSTESDNRLFTYGGVFLAHHRDQRCTAPYMMKGWGPNPRRGPPMRSRSRSRREVHAPEAG